MRHPASYGGETFGEPCPVAGVRTWVDVPVALAGGAQDVARVFTFTRLSDGREHLALALGPYRRPHRATRS